MRMTPNEQGSGPEQGQAAGKYEVTKDTVSWSKLIFADGTTLWTRGGPAADYVFHPVMLKYVLICVLLHALLHTRDAMAGLALWQISVYWFMVVNVTVLWLFLAVAIANRLLKSGRIRFIFTPLISLPLIVITESMFQAYMVWVIGVPFGGFKAFAPYMIRDLIVILLFDVMYGSFVAPHQPAFRMSDPRLDTSVDTPHTGVPPLGAPMPALPAGASGGPVPPLWPLSPPVPGPAVHPLAYPQPAAAAVPAAVAMPAQPEAVVPDLSEDAAVPEAAPAQGEAEVPDAEQTVELAGERIRVADLLVIKAEDHYVRIHQRGRSMLLRGRFSDVVAAVPPEMGIALNRSVWVAVAGVRSLHRTDDHRVMVLAMDEQMHPVARSRKTEVMDFARRHNLTIARRKIVGQQGE